MIVKIFGILDLLAALSFILLQWGIGEGLATFLAIYLIIKSIIFIMDFTSWIDLLAGVYLLLVIFNIHSIFSIIFILWLGQKAFFSLFV
ncbi:MAG: hypothetical protein KKG75_05070 [Nanoarchaeota archaeon]|nr:hypothetical protein [Nanoarchaeota archaeon]